MRYLQLLRSFLQLSIMEEMASRSNFFISLLNTLLNFGTGILGVVVLFDQVKVVQGWTFPKTLALLGAYLTLSALRGLVIGPSLDALAGLGGEVWTGRFDFTLLRPINTQFLVSFRYWRSLTLFDLLLGILVLATAMTQLHSTLNLLRLVEFIGTLFLSIAILYAILLAFTSFVFWVTGFLFTWVFDGIFQMARYPAGLYPGWLRLILTWVIPIGVMTTFPAQALTGALSTTALVASIILAVALNIGASLLFRWGMRRYTSASS